jgi:hypothetical protein
MPGVLYSIFAVSHLRCLSSSHFSAPQSCQPLQEALARLSSRVAALGADHSQALARNLYAPIQTALTDYVSDAPGSNELSPQERDTQGWRLVRALNFLGLLAKSPAVKAGLLQQQVAVQMTSLLRSASRPTALGVRLGMGAFGVLQNLVNPAVCLTPQAPLGQRMVEAAPSRDESQAVAEALLEVVSTLNIKDGRVAAALRVLGIMAANDLGRSAIASGAWKQAGKSGVTDPSGDEPMEDVEGSKGPFTMLWEALAAALGSSVKVSGGPELAKLLRSAAGLGLGLTDGGKNQHGTRVLHRLFEGASSGGGPVQQVVGLLEEVGQTAQGPALRSVNKVKLGKAAELGFVKIGVQPFAFVRASLSTTEDDAFDKA